MSKLTTSQPVLDIEDTGTHWHIKVLAPGYYKIEALIIDFTNNYEHAVKLGKEKDAAGNSGVYAFGGFVPNERTWGAYVGETNNFTNRIRSHMSTKATWFASLDRNTQWYLFAYPPNGNHWVKEDRTNIEDLLSKKIKELGGVSTTNQHNSNNYGQIGGAALDNITNDILYVIQRFTGWRVENPQKESMSEPHIGLEEQKARPEENLTLYLKDNGKIIAKVLYDSSNGGFVLLRGAKPRTVVVPSASLTLQNSWQKLQEECINGVTKEDIVFSSASSLASSVLGSSVNGKVALTDAGGKTLKQYIEEK